MADMKAFNVKVPKEIWQFIKTESVHQEKSMTEIVCGCLTRYKKKREERQKEKQLTSE